MESQSKQLLLNLKKQEKRKNIKKKCKVRGKEQTKANPKITKQKN